MALAEITLVAVKSILERLGSDAAVPRRIMSLGYPDILVHPDTIARLFGKEVAARLTIHPNSESIIRWHGVSSITKEIVESKNLLALLGFELEIVDIVQARGDEMIVNLNEPCPETLIERYGLVIDSGTSEHCFNIAQAAKNLASMVALGGYISQGNPLNMFNHGFYNLNPTWYYDFYQENGFVVESLQITHNAVHAPQVFDAPPYQRFQGVPDNCGIMMVAKRTEIKPIVWPIQTKYKNNPLLRG